MHNDGVPHEKVVVGTILCPIIEHGGSGGLASEASRGMIAGGAEVDETSRGMCGDRDNPSVEGQKGMENGEAIEVRTILCPIGENVDGKPGERPIVYF